jgi:hypothetical protein
MSYAFQEVNLPTLSVQNGSDLTFKDNTYLSDSWTELNPAHLRMMNGSLYDLLVTMKTSGDSFWLPAGDTILITLAPNEQGFLYVNKYTHAGTNPLLLYLTYFSNREEVLPLENSQAPPSTAVVLSGQPQTAGGTLLWGIPTSEKATTTSTTNLNANQVRYVWMKVEYSITVNAHQFEVTTTPASNANVRVGIYRADKTLQPTGAPLYDSGDIAVANGFTGIKTITGLSVALPAAMYLVAINIDTNMGMRAINVGTSAVDGTMGANCLVQKVVASQTYGAFPNPGTSWTTLNDSNAGMQHSNIWQWTE